MGSAGAWFAGYLKKDERNNNTSLRERLLDMLAAARRSDSAEELDQMQSEADDILRDTLQCFDHGAIEEGALTAFNIALDQFHNAVADRKALLIEHAAKPATGERAVPGRRHHVKRRHLPWRRRPQKPADRAGQLRAGVSTGRFQRIGRTTAWAASAGLQRPREA